MDQLKAQFVGSLTCVLVVTSVALIVMLGIRQIRGSWNLRVEKDGELEGLDIFEHGTPAYHIEFGYGSSYSTPTGTTVIGGGGLPRAIDLGEEKAEPQKV
jgi:ammonium transporter family